MFYETELVECEGSVAVLLPQNLLDKLNLTIGDSVVFLENIDGSISFKPLDKAIGEQMAAAKVGMEDYSQALAALANDKEIEDTLTIAKRIIEQNASVFEKLSDD